MDMDLVDEYGRSFKTLRISLTNVCNLACNYCVESKESPENPNNQNIQANTDSKLELSKQKLSPLSTEKLFLLTHKLVKTLGIETLRLTGGEPLLYNHIVQLIELLSTLEVKIKLTTNGVLLSSFLNKVAADSLDSINISIDALDEDIFYSITKRRNIHKVFEGIQLAVDKGIKVKLNCVVMKGINESEILPLLEYAKKLNISIRFLEVMNMGHLYHHKNDFLVSQSQILDIITQKYSVKLMDRLPSATANYWQTDGGHHFGIIANESEPFCQDCNRLRLDSYGNIFGCLSNEKGIFVANDLDDDTKIHHSLKEALSQKQAVKFKGSAMTMLEIGG